MWAYLQSLSLPELRLFVESIFSPLIYVDSIKRAHFMKTTITAHSGSDGTPDNSLEFVKYALTTNADALEIDIRKRDNQLLITHDVTDEALPTLDQVFQLVSNHPTMKVNCDLKEPNLELDVCKLAKSFNLEKRIILSGTVDADLNPIKDFPDVEIYVNIENYVPNLYLNYREIPDFEIQAADQICKVCQARNIHTININEVLVTRRFIELLKASGIGVSAWTVNHPLSIQWFLSKGITNITTRSPKKALEIRTIFDLNDFNTH